MNPACFAMRGAQKSHGGNAPARNAAALATGFGKNLAPGGPGGPQGAPGTFITQIQMGKKEALQLRPAEEPRRMLSQCSWLGAWAWHASDSLSGWGWVDSGGHRRPHDKPALPRGRAFSTWVDGQKKGRLSTTLWQKLVLLGSTVALKSHFALPCEKSLCHFGIRMNSGSPKATAMKQSSRELVGFML